jgi:hypothetical protein
MATDRTRAFRNLSFLDPGPVLIELRRIERSMPCQPDLPKAVRNLRTNELKHIRELREACLFCYGWAQIDGQHVYVAQHEAHDHDAVAMWIVDDTQHFAPIQIKEVVPHELNPATSAQGIVNGLQKYADSADLTVVIHLNQMTPFSPMELVVPPLKIAALWVLGAVSSDQSKWMIWGNFLEKIRWGEFEYPT